MEKWFNVDPDKGSGLFELAIIVFLVIAVSMLVLRARSRRAAARIRNRDERA
jgi:hypothetical protein